MGRVILHAADFEGGRIQRMKVQLGHLPVREIDRDTAISWMRDMHSFVPKTSAGFGAALQLVEVGDPTERFIRVDNQAVSEDSLPELPSLS